MNSEIGRQMKIFKGAAAVCVWCTRCLFPDLSKTIEEFLRQDDPAHPDSIIQWMTPDIVQYLTRDPWFSSLWTLQEAWLRRDARLLTREGKMWPQPVPLLKDLVWTFGIEYSHFTDRDDDEAVHMRNLLEKSGLAELEEVHHPLGLLYAARHRTARYEKDRFYGIMQIFDLRLGKSRPGADPQHDFTISELEDELGEHLLKEEPIMSQIFNPTIEPSHGKRWRPAWNFRTPSAAFYRSPNIIAVPKIELSTIRLHGHLWGYFRGRTCALNQISRVWSKQRNDPDVWLDWEAEFEEVTDHKPKNPRKHTVSKELALIQSRSEAIVAILGRFSGGNKMETLGLILDRLHGDLDGVVRWNRLGFCIWRDAGWGGDITPEESSFLKGDTEHWVSREGAFG